MQNGKMHPGERDDPGQLRGLLLAGRPTSELPPGFRNGVWRRVEHAAAEAGSLTGPWLWHLLEFLWRPRQALVAASVMLALGGVLGAVAEHRHADSQAQARYLALVAPQVIQ